ncbi:MAG TPA: SAM-dependent methyltransferase [Actinomycetota bacterium]|nr:SAM-dependent methyltransferase [Actinomycetota bacterium]
MNRTDARTRLARRLAERIEAEGPITFADFMETALYDEEAGFYSRPPVGRDGDFVTSPHVSPAFADLLARQLAQCWELLGRPEAFDVVELGAGDGTLATSILRAIGSVRELAAAARYVCVERSAGAREALAGAGLVARDELPETIQGVVLANELFDNLPFHRLRKRDGRLVEVFVGVSGGRFVEVEAEPTGEALGALTVEPDEGQEHVVSPRAHELVRGLAFALRKGYAIFFDYSAKANRPPPVQAFHGHAVSGDLLEEPGSRDITVAVDMDAIGDVAREQGLQVWGPVSQREALLALGYRIWSSGVRVRQTQAQERGDAREANRLFGERSSSTILIDEDKLGGLSVIVMGTARLEPPAIVLGDRAVGC